jgi:phosphate transport system substrate-binding protein
MARQLMVWLCFISSLALVGTARAEPLRGAGSTFAAPVLAKWAKNYIAERADGGDYQSPDWAVDYESVGSLGGVMRLRQQEMDFAATEWPLPPDEVTKHGYAQFPIVIGGLAIVINVEGIQAGGLRLTGPLLADIYLGKIQNWSDPAIKAVNPDVALPEKQIKVVHRSDGSGSTFVFTQYLSLVSTEWRDKHGADTLIKWPAGMGGKGSQGVIKTVASTDGSITYVEYGQVAQGGLAYALLRNRDGAFVRPGRATFQAAANAVDWTKSVHFFESLTDQPGAAAYPLTTATFALVALRGRENARVKRVQDFFRLAYDKGPQDATALGYVPLPPALVKQITDYWQTTTKSALR